MNYLKRIAFLLSVFPTILLADEGALTESCPAGDESIACRQKAAVEEIWVDMNKSYTTMTDDLIQNPDKAIDAGCLDGIMQMDLSVITVDPYGIWASVYAGLKDELMNMACNAVEEKANEASAYLDSKLEAPMGLGSVSLAEHGQVGSFSDLSETRVTLDNHEAREKVVSEVFGEYPKVNRRQWAEQQIEQRRIENGGVSTMSKRHEDAEKVKSVLDLNSIFGGEKEEKNDDNQ